MENFPSTVGYISGHYQIIGGNGGFLSSLDGTDGSSISCCDEPQDPADKQVWLIIQKDYETINIFNAKTGYCLGNLETHQNGDSYNHSLGSAYPSRHWRLRSTTPNNEWKIIENVKYPGYVLDLPYGLKNNKINLHPVGWPIKLNQIWRMVPVEGMITASALRVYKEETSTAMRGVKDANDQIKQLTSNLETEQNKVTELRRNLQNADVKATELDAKLTAAEAKLSSTNEALAAATAAAETANNTEIEALKKELGAAKARAEADGNTIKGLTKATELAKAKAEADENTIKDLTKATEVAKAALATATAAAETANNTEIESLKKELLAVKAKAEADENTVKDLTKTTEVAKAALATATFAAETANNTEIESLKKELVAVKAKAEADENTIKDLTKAIQATTSTTNGVIEEEEEEEEEEEKEFEGKLAIIDGAGSIFGRAVALLLHKRGAILALNDEEDSIGLEETAKLFPSKAIIWKSRYKTTIFSEATTFTALINGKHPGGISYIFNCTSFQSSLQVESSPDYLNRRLCALVYLTRATIPYLAANASYINVSCMSGQWLRDHTPPEDQDHTPPKYNTNKEAVGYAIQHGVIGFSKSIVIELQERMPGVRMNILATEYIDKIEDKQREKKRVEAADTMAEAAEYLFSKKSKRLNGSILDIDEEVDDEERKSLYW